MDFFYTNIQYIIIYNYRSEFKHNFMSIALKGLIYLLELSAIQMMRLHLIKEHVKKQQLLNVIFTERT